MGFEMSIGFSNPPADSVQVWTGDRWVMHALFSEPPEAIEAAGMQRAGRAAPAVLSGGEGASLHGGWGSAGDQFLGGAHISSSLCQALLTCHYSLHDAFLSPGQLLGGVDALAGIPIIGVHGRNDHVCPVGTAYALHLAMPWMELRVVSGAGHSPYQDAMTHELVWAVDRIHALLAGQQQHAASAAECTLA
jgi:pimeloyl-ACP methyl ester carboxylesterase